MQNIRDLAGALQTDHVERVEQAVDALSRQVRQSAVEGRLAQVMPLAQAIRESLPPDATLDTEDLYDEAGLPR